MTLAARSFPLSLDAALVELKDALGANYGGPVDTESLTRALSRDALLLLDGLTVHPRPWATAARLIRWNTEYEVNKGLQARIDRKLKDLDEQQKEADIIAGIIQFVPDPTALDEQKTLNIYVSSVLDNEAVF